MNLADLEDRIEQLIACCAHLHKENRQLRERSHQLAAERDELQQRCSDASRRTAAIIKRLRREELGVDA